MENEKLIEEIKDKIEDVYHDKVSPFKDMSTQRKADEIKKKIRTEQEAQHYAEDRYDRIHDRDFFTKYGKDIPESLVKGEERAQQKAELKALKQKIEAQLDKQNDIKIDKNR